MKVLLVGSGGREHALAWQIARSPLCSGLFCAPGNAGMEECARLVPLAAEDIDGLVAFARDEGIELVVIGPEAPLVAGLADRLEVAGIKAFGPSAAAAQLEGSKGFMKELCTKNNIPTAAYGRFTDIGKARAFIEAQGAPIVIKADGLAAGKGVVIAQTIEEAVKAAEDMLSGGAFGDAGRSIVVEEFLDGEELSFFAISDGQMVLPLTSAQDHKRVGEGDTGPNTGGMGAYSPAHMMTPALEQQIMQDIIMPTVEGMAEQGRPFKGVLFAGLMLVEGAPKLLEYNVRFGDPECQPLMMRLQSDILEIMNAAAEERLADYRDRIFWSPEAALCVVMAAEGYPGAYKKNTVINGVSDAAAMENTMVFHAGTSRSADGHLVNTGGRVLGVTARGSDIAQARDRAYEAVEKISWSDGFYRRDIGWRALDNKKEGKKSASA